MHSHWIQCIASCSRRAARVAAWFSSISKLANIITKTHSNLTCTTMCRPIDGCTPRHLLSNAHGHLTGCHSCQSTPRHTGVSRRPRLQIQVDSCSCPRRTLKAQRLLDAVLQAPEIIETDATRALHSSQHLQQTGAFSLDTVHCFMFEQGGARGCVVFLNFQTCQHNRKSPF